MEQMVAYFAIRFFVRQLAKTGRSVDGAAVKAEWDVWVRDHVPGTWLDDEMVALTNAIIDGGLAICQQSDSDSALLEKAAAKDWKGAEIVLAGLLKATVGGKLLAALAA